MSRGDNMSGTTGRHDAETLQLSIMVAFVILVGFALLICFFCCTGYRRYYNDQVIRKKFVNKSIPWKKYGKKPSKGGNGLEGASPTTVRDAPEAAPHDEDVCSICLVPFAKGDKVSWSTNSDICMHTYHKKCIVEWLYQHSDCPMCRETFLKEEATEEDNGDDPLGTQDEETGNVADTNPLRTNVDAINVADVGDNEESFTA